MCSDASIFKDETSFEHGTSFVLNRTHPDGVRNTFLQFGVGRFIFGRTGGLNTETTNNPTKQPINNHNRDIIVFTVVFYSLNIEWKEDIQDYYSQEKVQRLVVVCLQYMLQS